MESSTLLQTESQLSMFIYPSTLLALCDVIRSRKAEGNPDFTARDIHALLFKIAEGFSLDAAFDYLGSLISGGSL